jgi:hypothetical protein
MNKKLYENVLKELKYTFESVKEFLPIFEKNNNYSKIIIYMVFYNKIKIE